MISNAQATTLSEAVNNQLATKSTPCETLLGGDPGTVLVGNLGSVICQRSVPFGSTPQATAGSATANELSGTTTLLTQVVRSEDTMDKAQVKTSISAKWSVFMTTESGSLKREVSNDEAGFDSRIVKVLFGSTYAFSDNNTFGTSVSLNRHDGDYDGGGDFANKLKGWRFFEIYQPSAQFYLQTVAGIDSVASQRTRATSFEEYFNGGLVFYQAGTPSADHGYQQREISLQSGYTFYQSSFTFTPQLAMNWLVADYGNYRESGDSGLELMFHDDKRESLQSVLGIQCTRNISTSRAVVIPQFDIYWKHEFSDKSRQVNVSFVDDTRGKQFSYDTQAADRDYMEIGAGIAFVFINGTQTFIRAQTTVGQQYVNSALIMLGFNWEL